MIEIYASDSSEGCNVGAGVDVAMGIMMNIAVNKSVIAAKEETEEYS